MGIFSVEVFANTGYTCERKEILVFMHMGKRSTCMFTIYVCSLDFRHNIFYYDSFYYGLSFVLFPPPPL